MDLPFIINNALQICIGAGLLSILYGIFLSLLILKNPRGDEKMNEIADAIAAGASAFLKRQYTVVLLIGVIILAILYFAFDLFTAVGFGIGAIFSAVAGIVGMTIAVRSNIRTAEAAKSGLSKAFS